MKTLTPLALVFLLALTGCASNEPSSDLSTTITETSTPAADPTASASSSSTTAITIDGEPSGTTHLVEYRAYTSGGLGKTADATVRWTTKKLPKFEDFSDEWTQTMAFPDGEWASVLVIAKEDVNVGCELYFDGELIDSQGMDSDEYKVECKSYVE